jgi:hypothetical protein
MNQDITCSLEEIKRVNQKMNEMKLGELVPSRLSFARLYIIPITVCSYCNGTGENPFYDDNDSEGSSLCEFCQDLDNFCNLLLDTNATAVKDDHGNNLLETRAMSLGKTAMVLVIGVRPNTKGVLLKQHLGKNQFKYFEQKESRDGENEIEYYLFGIESNGCFDSDPEQFLTVDLMREFEYAFEDFVIK